MELLSLSAIVFLAVLIVALAMMNRHDDMNHQQMVLSRMSAPLPEDVEEVDITRPARLRQAGLTGGLFSSFRLTRRLEENLWQAGLYLKVSDVLALMGLLAAAGGAAGAVWSGAASLASIAFGVGLGMLPLAYVWWRKLLRLRAFDQQLPEILDIVKSSLDAGHTLQRALQVAVEEFSDPASSELRIALEQNRLGVPLARALEYMLDRVPNENLRFLVVAVKIQTEVGSSLASIITELARTIRERHRLAMKVRVLTAQPRISGMIGGLMPIVLLFALNFVHRETVTMLFYDPAGRKLIEAAAVLEACAFLTIYRMMRVDY
jgi:tight adherence protein B